MKPSPASKILPASDKPALHKLSFTRWRSFLLITPLLLLALLPLSRHYLLSKPPPPPASSGIKALMGYYVRRIETDPSDVEAYVKLGKLDAASGYYTDALDHLYEARAVGAKEQDIIVPIGHALTYLAHYDEARAELQKATRLMPDSLTAVVALAELHVAEGNPEAASKVLRDFAARRADLLTGSSLEARQAAEQLMFSFFQAGDEEMTYKMAENVIRLAPNQPDGYSTAGKLLLTRHDPKAALIRLEKAVQLAPNEAVLLYTYGLALQQNGREADALKQWQKTVALNPAAIDAYEHIAEVYYKRKDYGHAATALQMIALHNEGNLNAVHATALMMDKAGQKTAAAYWHSIELRQHKNFPLALSYARQVEADPAWRTRGLSIIAEIYKGMNRMDDYLNTMRQMTAGHSAEADVAMSEAYGTADRLSEQVEALKRALANNPKDPARIHLLLSQVALRKGLRDEAEAELQQSIALNPQNPIYHQALGGIYLDRRNEGDRMTRAIQEFEQFKQLNPDEVLGYQKLGIAYAASGDLRRAARNLEHVLDLLPGDGPSYQELGRVYARLGDKTRSERMFQLYRMYVSHDLKKQTLITKSRADQKDAAAQLALAEFLEQEGDFAGAARYYRLAYTLRPTDTSIRNKIQHVNSLQGQAGN